tara:strand:+ start:294 stop:566 length:273 start_codon:yes stop_codon:yes gene_type:complete
MKTYFVLLVREPFAESQVLAEVLARVQEEGLPSGLAGLLLGCAAPELAEQRVVMLQVLGALLPVLLSRQSPELLLRGDHRLAAQRAVGEV